MGGTRGSLEVRSTVLAGRSPPFLSRDRAAISVYVDRERRSLRYHECDLQSRREKTEVSAATRPNLANPRTSPVMAAPTPREAKQKLFQCGEFLAARISQIYSRCAIGCLFRFWKMEAGRRRDSKIFWSNQIRRYKNFCTGTS